MRESALYLFNLAQRVKNVHLELPLQVDAECLPNETAAKEICRKLAERLGRTAQVEREAYRSLEGETTEAPEAYLYLAKKAAWWMKSQQLACSKD